ncbi:MAG: ATP-binding protein [Bacteroidales bacterium]|nr:ATP-binding protein [Bacteroidales bacterium]
MKFYDRKSEIETLQEILDRSNETAQFTVVTGRRRIGKTTLLCQAYKDTTVVYFFVARTAEKALCATYAQEIVDKLQEPILGTPENFSQVFEYALSLSIRRNFTLIIDEFQEFLKINPSIYSEMQRIWDKYEKQAKINLVVSGSVNTLMSKLFRDKKEPLFGRQTRFIHLRPFAPSVLGQILADHYPAATPLDLLALYALTGGVAKYVQLLIDNKAYTPELMLSEILRDDSIFIGEGKTLLIEELGKEYAIYFSILEAISSGKTTRNEIQQAVGKEVGGYLTRLEDIYQLIEKKQPIFEKTSNKNVTYHIADNFLAFWFRFIFKYGYMLEVQQSTALLKIIQRDFSQFCGLPLERLFRAVLIEMRLFTRMGSWWDRKGNNEIDLVCENEFEKTATFFEVKKNLEKYNPAELGKKIDVFLRATHQFEGYTLTQDRLALTDLEPLLHGMQMTLPTEKSSPVES